VRQGVNRCFGAIAPGVARGLKLRHDHGSNYISGDFQDEIKCLGIEASPSFVREPEGNGVAERFIRMTMPSTSEPSTVAAQVRVPAPHWARSSMFRKPALSCSMVSCFGNTINDQPLPGYMSRCRVAMVFWLIKDLAFPDPSWQRKVTIGGVIIAFVSVLGWYWVFGWLLISAAAQPHYPLPDRVWFCLCISMCMIGTTIMVAADAQI
jgi:transposase InsO family protein